MKIEVLYFDGCPGHERLLERVRDLVAADGITLQRRRIETVEEAEAAGFLGSPTVRINGVDIEPGAQQRADFGLKCRLYPGLDGLSGLPPQEWIERAVREAIPAQPSAG